MVPANIRIERDVCKLQRHMHIQCHKSVIRLLRRKLLEPVSMSFYMNISAHFSQESRKYCHFCFRRVREEAGEDFGEFEENLEMKEATEMNPRPLKEKVEVGVTTITTITIITTITTIIIAIIMINAIITITIINYITFFRWRRASWRGGGLPTRTPSPSRNFTR